VHLDVAASIAEVGRPAVEVAQPRALAALSVRAAAWLNRHRDPVSWHVLGCAREHFAAARVNRDRNPLRIAVAVGGVASRRDPSSRTRDDTLRTVHSGLSTPRALPGVCGRAPRTAGLENPGWLVQEELTAAGDQREWAGSLTHARHLPRSHSGASCRGYRSVCHVDLLDQSSAPMYRQPPEGQRCAGAFRLLAEGGRGAAAH
jgi:hypothetical protein